MILSKTSRTPWFMLALAAVQFTASMAQEATYRDPSAITTAQVPSSSSSSSPSPTTFQSSTSTGSFEPQTHTIQVGLADHKMRPETTEAAIGDIVEFDFYPLNHSVVRAEYGFPCIPYEMAGSDKTGFFSGFNSVDRVLDNPPKYSVRINDTEPIFFYCSAPGSCITYGMVGGINLNSSMSIDKQRTLAMDSAYMLQPGEPFPGESPLPSNNPAFSPTSTFNSISTSTSAPAVNTHPSPVGLSQGAIAGIVVAAVCAIFFGASLFFCWGRTKSLREEILRKDGTLRRASASPNQMVGYKQPSVHAHPSHAHSGSRAGYHFPAHPGSPSPGVYAHQHSGSSVSMNTGYFPANYPVKHTSLISTHPAYQVVPSGSPPQVSIGLNGGMYMHPSVNDTSSRGTPAPGYYETFNYGQEQRPRPVEMEAITPANPAESEDSHGGSKL